MGTKNNPGSFDCYKNALPDEPMFILLARDPEAPLLIRLWANIRRRIGDDLKAEEAEKCASEMESWRNASPRKLKRKLKRREFEQTPWTPNPTDYMLENKAAEPNCKGCKGHGTVDLGYDTGCVLANCPDCWK